VSALPPGHIPTRSADARLVSAADELDNARAILMDLRREGARAAGNRDSCVRCPRLLRFWSAKGEGEVG